MKDLEVKKLVQLIFNLSRIKILSLNFCLNFIEEIIRGLSMQEVKDVFEIIEEVI